MSLNILVVDDSDIIRAMIAKTLRLAQIPIGGLYEASNGREALALMDEAWIDLVLADINMPVMSGDEMIKAMQSLPETSDIPVIVVSTEGAEERIQLLRANGVVEWIRKPFTPEEIRDAVSNVTDAFERRRPVGTLIDQAFELVLEQFTFCFADERPDPMATPQAETDPMLARVAFNGCSSGILTIAAPRSLCVEWAANVLGVEPDADDAVLRGADALGEVANMTCGHIATALEAHHPTDLHPPVVTKCDESEWLRLASNETTRGYLVEDRVVLVSLGLHQMAGMYGAA